MEDLALGGHHRGTLEKIFSHPLGHNIQWHDVLSLLEHLGAVKSEGEGPCSVTLGSETHVFAVSRHHDLEPQQLVDLRRMLKEAGITPDSM